MRETAAIFPPGQKVFRRYPNFSPSLKWPKVISLDSPTSFRHKYLSLNRWICLLFFATIWCSIIWYKVQIDLNIDTWKLYRTPSECFHRKIIYCGLLLSKFGAECVVFATKDRGELGLIQAIDLSIKMISKVILRTKRDWLTALRYPNPMSPRVSGRISPLSKVQIHRSSGTAAVSMTTRLCVIFIRVAPTWLRLKRHLIELPEKLNQMTQKARPHFVFLCPYTKTGWWSWTKILKIQV